ncbi:hypothetical protein RHGRI_013219 [Rhododendron griersonianum]|uniref:RING-type E3 ubiquitin transferase n=1 Tax=Rhododendron griersonianum TaxID=479676 RepID=A0AAV6K4Y1_9ERIC|nr:hypothetical protein RHGRI_013219 [Rhododendron griersonianum]
MNRLILLFSLLHSFFCCVEAQSSSGHNFESVGAVFAFLFILFIVLATYIKFWNRTRVVHDNQQTVDGSISPNPRSSGIDKILIESLPFFKFSALKGLRGGLECAVCLSKFEDIEVLRLLPRCKHAFHINCVDQWLENHSSCPLCRQKISVEDLTYSNSLRFLSSQSEVREGSNVELFVQREDSRRHGSSRFSIGSSFRIFDKGVVKDDELPIREDSDVVDKNDKFLHKFNHKIVMSDAVQRKMSDAVLKSRWSNLSSSDLLFLNSEMLGDVSSNRFPPLDLNAQESPTTQATEEGGIAKIKDKMGSEREFETKFGKLSQNDSRPLSSGANTSNPTRNLHPNEKRSMSEIAVRSRFEEFNTRNNNSVKESSVPKIATKEERLKRLWLPIARKTVQSYGNRDRKYRRFEEFNTRNNNSVKGSSVPEIATKEERLKRLWLPIARKTVQSYGNRDRKYRQSLNV